MKDTHYTQCRMQSEKGHFHVAWIPSPLAKKGKLLTIDEFPELKWKITDVYVTRPKDQVISRINEFLHHREATDI